MMQQILKKMFDKIIKLIEHRRINNNINRLQSLEIKPARGNADWLALCEIKMGGIQQNVTRLQVSDLDPRSKIHIQTGGMTGGDRMIHHNYAKLYERYLSRFIGTSENLNILECGILKGTGLAVWSELFPKALLIGLDIDLDHIKSNFEFLKSRGAFQNNDPLLLNFDQFSPDVSELSEAIGSEKLNIIIDDGFHSDETILNTIYALKPFFAENFVYFAEDNSTVYPKIKENFQEYKVESFGQMTVITSNNIS
jgi:hypothetical protein